MKKISLVLLLLMVTGILSACGEAGDFDTSQTISVYTRDTSSGTRDGFMSGIGFKEASANDSILVSGFATQNNAGIMQAMTTDEYGIGYVSLSSLNNTIKGLNFDGVEPTEANVINDTYGLKRPFVYMTRADDDFENETMKALTLAFIAFLHSTDGADVINNEGAIALPSTETWESIVSEHDVCGNDNSSLTLNFGGSDSITRIAEALSAAFSPRCGDVQTVNNHTGSSDGFKRSQGDEKDGVNGVHVGYSSRPFRGEEIDTTDASTRGQLAWDAIVAIVHKSNPIESVTADELKAIYSGDITAWQELIE